MNCTSFGTRKSDNHMAPFLPSPTLTDRQSAGLAVLWQSATGQSGSLPPGEIVLFAIASFGLAGFCGVFRGSQDVAVIGSF